MHGTIVVFFCGASTEIIMLLQIHKVKREWGLAQSVANVKHIAGRISPYLKLIFDEVWVYRVMKVAQDHPLRSFPPRLVGMVTDVVGPKFSN